MLDRSHFTAALAAAADPAAAGHALVAAVGRIDDLAATLWLERAGRLRCAAAHGRRQVADGSALDEGPLGRAFTSGRPVVEVAPLPEPAELVLPIHLDGRVVGCLDVLAPVAPSPALTTDLEWAVDAYIHRLRALGGPPPATPAERLLRHSVALGGMTDAREIAVAVVEAARDVSGLESALLLLRDGSGWTPSAHAGALADALAAGDGAALAALADLAGPGTSGRTIDAIPPVPTAPDDAAPAPRSAVALTIGPPSPLPRAVLVVVDPAAPTPSADRIALLELLAAHAASCLRTVDAVADLREQASADPLTGLGHHATFHHELAAARSRKGGVAVVIADIDGFKAINDHKGHQAGDRVLREVASALSAALRRGDALYRIGGDEFAALIAVKSADEALEAGRRLCAAAAATGTLTVSVGIAIPRFAESDASVLTRADRALDAVKRAGRDGVEIDA